LRVVTDEPIHVVVDHRRRVTAPNGVIVTRRVDFGAVVQSNRSPPRARVEEALVDVASDAGSVQEAIAVLADACQEGRTTVDRLRVTVARRGRVRRRPVLLAILGDVAHGALSVLERRYLVDVERAHALPRARRQRRFVTRAGVAFRDVDYSDFTTVVELDGRLVHDRSATAWPELLRDIETSVEGSVTVRLRWIHVLDPCRAAGAIARLLSSRGWRGSVRPCGPTCALHHA
jgi:hypothetical protein